MPKSTRKSKSVQKASAPASSTEATMVVTLYDGTRSPIQDRAFLIRIFDGSQNLLFDRYKPAPTNVFRIEVHDNFQDFCTVLATGDGYVDAGFHPVKLSTKAVASVDLLLLSDKGDFKFQSWQEIKASDPKIASFIAVGSSDDEASERYEDLRANRAAALASLLNLSTAMKSIQLPAKTPLDYFKQILWDESLAQDRFFGYADKSIIDQVRRAAMEGEFAPEPNPALFHPDATSSFKQIQFGEANVQLTFHEKDTKRIDGVDCIKIEPDIDYYKDLGAHTLLEVLPNSISHGLTDPKKVYVLRWIAGRHAGVPEFSPPYVIA